MLKLKRIQIQGFKSFADKTELTFDGAGVAAIVGPNGCGKSNISDAVAWVLGEQSAKSLRGGRMQDVIFNGTRSRLPLGLAEVTVTLVDPECAKEGSPPSPPLPDAAPVHENPEPSWATRQPQGSPRSQEPQASNPSLGSSSAVAVKKRKRHRFVPKPGELVVSRRLFRSGDSEYLLNGRQVRLRDVQDVFLGTGLGPDSYALIEQDRVGLILSSKPSDRRAIIEEAAGITKFKAKRKLAASKLEQAKQNLLRINDITEEVSRQLNSLKRQAAKARRYRTLHDRMSELSRSLFSARARKLKAQLEQASRRFEEVRAQVDQKHQFIREQESQFRQGNNAIFEADTALKQQREQLSQLNLESERARQNIRHQNDQLSQLQARSRENEGELQQLSEQEQQHQKEVGEKQRDLQEVIRQFDRLEEQYSSQNLESESQQTRLYELEAASDRMRSEQLELSSRAATLRSETTQLVELEKQLARQTSRLEEERQQSALSRLSLAASYELASSKHQQQEADLLELTNKVEALSAELRQSKEQWSRAQRECTEKREETSAQGHRLQSLEELAIHHAYSAESVRLLLSVANESQGGTFQTEGILADLLEVDSAHETAVEEFLRHELEYLLVDSPSSAREGIELLRRSGTGRSTFLFHSNGSSEEGPDELEALLSQLVVRDPRLIPVSRVIRLPSQYRQRLRSALPHLFHSLIAPSYEVALDLAQAYPRLTVLTPEGEVIRGRLISGGGRAARGHLSLKREIRELDRGLESMRRDQSVLEERLTELGQSVQRREEELSRINRQAQGLDKALVGSNHELQNLRSEIERVNQRDGLASLEIQRTIEERSHVGQQRIRSGFEISEAEARQAQNDHTIKMKQNDLRQLKVEAVQASHQLSEVRSELAASRERKVAAETDLARLLAGLEACHERTAKLNAQRQEWSRQGLEIQESVRQLEEAVFNQAVRRASLESEIRTRESQLEESRQVQVNLGEGLQRWRQELDELQNEKTRIEVDRARLASDMSHLEESCRHEIGQTLESLAVEAASQFSEEGFQELEEEHQQLKRRLDSMGPVNMMALEEFQECEQRFEFLNKQRQDLLDSIEDTSAAIGEIDEVSREQFREAFEAVNQNFTASFRDLFGGGHGEMKLLDQQELLDSGIEIIAQPPGKRLQNVLLLSGGEKALTAIALLLAIFDYQPSPFCVLDEVDAPLDDVNLGRYSQKIKAMSGETQFLLITHSKRTMEVADTLYGVTMQEAGVSKLVSVQMH